MIGKRFTLNHMLPRLKRLLEGFEVVEVAVIFGS
jgi:hypothetical protein